VRATEKEPEETEEEEGLGKGKEIAGKKKRVNKMDAKQIAKMTTKV